ncbi:hypothetical protein [uncultured Thioclava sp.]|uniref:hypothetical protein n=1 Tax=uncultured Thioclava sp. TaxID=473858 RepID=UPI0025D2E26A|nr:hypothetical protein [uncultured Thioclava sp.]
MILQNEAGFQVDAAYLIAGLAEGLAGAAAVLKVIRPGAADVIPTRAEVDDFIANQPSE